MSSASRRRPLLSILALLLCLALSQRCKAVPQNAKAPQRKLAIRILITEAPRQASRPTQQRRGSPDFPSQPIKVAERGKPIAARVYFQDCQPDSAGNCDIEVDLHGETSRGVRFGESEGQVLWNKAAPKPGVSQAGTSYMRVVIDPTDPAGTYRVLAMAYDRNSGSSANAEATFEVK
jgi:hypothetical protein